MAKSYISKKQLTKLQVLYGQAAAGSLQPARKATSDGACATQDARQARLAWASRVLGREVRSFNELTRREAAACIDALSGDEGQNQTQGPSPASRDQDDKARGTEGRKAKAAGEGARATLAVTLAGPEELGRIADALTRLGWDQPRFEAWLRSPTSPLGRRARSNLQVRTLGEANRVWWAMKKLLKRSGQWHPDNPEAA